MQGTLNVRILRAEFDKDHELFGKQDPYCMLRLSGQEIQTSADKKGGKYPEWNELVEFPIHGDEHVLFIDVYDKERILSDDLIGEGFIGFEELIKCGELGTWVELTLKGKLVGNILIQGDIKTPAVLPPAESVITKTTTTTIINENPSSSFPVDESELKTESIKDKIKDKLHAYSNIARAEVAVMKEKLHKPKPVEPMVSVDRDTTGKIKEKVVEAFVTYKEKAMDTYTKYKTSKHQEDEAPVPKVEGIAGIKEKVLDVLSTTVDKAVIKYSDYKHNYPAGEAAPTGSKVKDMANQMKTSSMVFLDKAVDKYNNYKHKQEVEKFTVYMDKNATEPPVYQSKVASSVVERSDDKLEELARAARIDNAIPAQEYHEIQPIEESIQAQVGANNEPLSGYSTSESSMAYANLSENPIPDDLSAIPHRSAFNTATSRF